MQRPSFSRFILTSFLLAATMMLQACGPNPKDTTAESPDSSPPVLTPEQAMSTQTNPALSKLYQDCKIDSILFDDRGMPSSIRGTLTFGADSTEPSEIVIDFLERHRDLWRMKDPRSEFRIERVYTPGKHRKSYGFSLLQNHNGIDVFHSWLDAGFDASLRLKRLAVRYFPGVAVDTQPTIDSTQAKEIAAQLENRTVDQCEFLAPELTIFPWNKDYFLCWKVLLRYDRSSWLLFIDAHSGKEVHRVDMIHSAAPTE